MTKVFRTLKKRTGPLLNIIDLKHASEGASLVDSFPIYFINQGPCFEIHFRRSMTINVLLVTIGIKNDITNNNNKLFL